LIVGTAKGSIYLFDLSSQTVHSSITLHKLNSIKKVVFSNNFSELITNACLLDKENVKDFSSYEFSEDPSTPRENTTVETSQESPDIRKSNLLQKVLKKQLEVKQSTPLPLREKDLGLNIPKIQNDPPTLEESPIMKKQPNKETKRLSTGNIKSLGKPLKESSLEDLTQKFNAFEARFENETKGLKEKLIEIKGDLEKYNTRNQQKFDEILQAMKFRDDQLSTSLSAIANPKNDHNLSNEAQQLTLLGNNMSYMADQLVVNFQKQEKNLLDHHNSMLQLNDLREENEMLKKELSRRGINILYHPETK